MLKKLLVCIGLVYLYNFAAHAEILNQDFIRTLNIKKAKAQASKSLYNQTVKEGVHYFNQGLNKEAKDIFWQAIDMFPDNPDAYVNLSIAHIKDKDYESALRFLERAKELADPDYYNSEILFYNLGLCQYMSKDTNGALVNFKKALEIYPGFSQAKCYLGLCYEQLGQKEKSYLNVFASLSGINPENRQLIKDLEIILIKLENDPGLDKAALSQDLLKEGQRTLASNKLRETARLLEESARLDPGSTEPYYELARLYSRQGVTYNSLIYLNRVIEAEPKSVSAYLSLAYAYRELNNYCQAEQAFLKAIEINPANATIYYELAKLHLENNKLYTAQKYLKKAKRMALKEKNLEMLEKIDDILQSADKEKGEKKESLRFYKKVAAQRPPKLPYPYHQITGNQGNLNKGYFQPVPEIKRDHSKTKITTASY